VLKNELLQQAQAKIEEGVTDRASYDKLLAAGTKTIYDQATFAKLSASLAESENPVEDIAKGLVSLLHLIAQKARGTLPHDVLLQAGMALMLDALDFAEQAGLIKVDAATLDTATQEFIEAALPSVGLTAEKMAGILDGVKQTMGNPERMAAFEQSQGGAK
jgi:hypothetical protein